MRPDAQREAAIVFRQHRPSPGNRVVAALACFGKTRMIVGSTSCAIERCVMASGAARADRGKAAISPLLMAALTGDHGMSAEQGKAAVHRVQGLRRYFEGPRSMTARTICSKAATMGLLMAG